jgi:hypothetical protein
MTLETYKFITNRGMYDQLHGKYRIELIGKSDYNCTEIIIDVSVDLTLVSIESVAPIGVEIGGNEGNGIEIVVSSCIEQPVLELFIHTFSTMATRHLKTL